MADVDVNLYQADETFLGSRTTDVNGYYGFYGLEAGDYYVEFLPPAGYGVTLLDAAPETSPGNSGGNPHADPKYGRLGSHVGLPASSCRGMRAQEDPDAALLVEPCCDESE